MMYFRDMELEADTDGQRYLSTLEANGIDVLSDGMMTPMWMMDDPGDHAFG